MARMSIPIASRHTLVVKASSGRAKPMTALEAFVHQYEFTDTHMNVNFRRDLRRAIKEVVEADRANRSKRSK